MTSQQQGLITLLKSAITGEAYPLPDDFVLEDALPLIKKHHMLPLVYTGACYCGIDRQSETMQSMLMRYYQFLLKSEGQMRAIKQIYAAFDEYGIDYMPLKGCNMKPLYPSPELRTMGDADILIRVEQYPRIIPILEAMGFSAAYESNYELVWHSKELHLELHKQLVATENKNFCAYFGDGWRLGTIKCGTKYAMSAENEMIYLFIHFARHFRDGGIGCRHVLDLWVFRRANPNLDEEYIKIELNKLHLLEFYENICRLMDSWFENATMDERTDVISDYIFSSGSWGTVSSRAISLGLQHDSDPSVKGSARFHYFWCRAFPSIGTLEDKYPVLQKAPWMLPLVWIYRPIYKIFFERKSLRYHASRMDVMDEQHIDERKQTFRYMGLAYDFGDDEAN